MALSRMKFVVAQSGRGRWWDCTIKAKRDGNGQARIVSRMRLGSPTGIDEGT